MMSSYPSNARVQPRRGEYQTTTTVGDGQHPELVVSDDYKHNYRLLNKALDQ